MDNHVEDDVLESPGNGLDVDAEKVVAVVVFDGCVAAVSAAAAEVADVLEVPVTMSRGRS